MKKLLLFLLIAISLVACGPSVKEQKALFNKVLGGKYELRKFNVKTSTSTETSAWWFIVAGGMSSSTEETAMVRFYFKAYNGEYTFMEKEFQNVVVKIEPNITIPYVTFEYSINTYSHPNYKWDITKVIIHCRDEDFSPDININTLK